MGTFLKKVSFLRVTGILLIILIIQNIIELTTASPTCPKPEYKDDKIFPKGTQFTRATVNSKYLIPKEVFRVSAQEGIKICEELGLQAAIMSWSKDYWEIVNNIVIDKKLQTDLFLTGGVPNVKNGTFGEYVDARLKHPLKFQLFELDRTVYYKKGADCLVLNCTSGECSFIPKHCKSAQVVPICQYREESECGRGILNNETDKDGKLEQDAFLPLNASTTTTISYFGSKHQRTWEEAIKACKKIGMKLLFFNKTNNLEMDAIMSAIKNYRVALDLPSWATFSWTSGQFNGKYGENQWFHFKGYDLLWQFAENLGRWDWPHESLVTKPTKELCLAVVSTNPRTVRPLPCDHFPNYFICQKDNSSTDKPSKGRSMDAATAEAFKNFFLMFAGNHHQREDAGNVTTNRTGAPPPYSPKCKPPQNGRAFKKPTKSKTNKQDTQQNMTMTFNFGALLQALAGVGGGGQNYSGLPDCPQKEPPKTGFSKKKQKKPEDPEEDGDVDDSSTEESLSDEEKPEDESKEVPEEDSEEDSEEDEESEEDGDSDEEVEHEHEQEEEEEEEVEERKEKKHKSKKKGKKDKKNKDSSENEGSEEGGKPSKTSKDKSKKKDKKKSKDAPSSSEKKDQSEESRLGRSLGRTLSNLLGDSELSKKSAVKEPSWAPKKDDSKKKRASKKEEKIQDASKEFDLGNAPKKHKPQEKTPTRQPKPTRPPQKIHDASKEIEIGATGRPLPPPETRTHAPPPEEQKVLDASKEIELGATGRPTPPPETRTHAAPPEEKKALDASKELEIGAAGATTIPPETTTHTPPPQEDKIVDASKEGQVGDGVGGNR